MGKSECIAKIKDINIFRDLSDAELEKVAALSKEVTASRGSPLIQESDIGNTMFLIVSGRADVKVSIPGGQNQEVIATIADGEVVGELILVGRSRRSASVYARDDLKALMWQRDDLNKLFDENKHIGFCVMRNIADLLADRLVSTNMILRNVLTIPRMTI